MFQDKISIIRILDSRKENFKLSKHYSEKIDIVDVVTAPEIELLIILSEDKLIDFNRQKSKNKQLKPNEYCKIYLKYKDVKSYNFYKEYFKDIDKLINAIKKYKSHKQLKHGEYVLYDIIKPELLR